MPTRKTEQPETVDELINELESANETIKSEVEKAVSDSNSEGKPLDEPLDNKRDELLKLAEDGDLDKSISYIKKASQKVIDKLYTEYERRRMQKVNGFLSDLLISKFSALLGGFDAIEDPELLSDDLKKDDLLKRDVYSLVETISPYLPCLGLLS